VAAIAPVVCVQNRYSIDDSGDDLLGICGQQGIAFVPFFAIAGERKSAGGGADPTDPVLAVARALDATPAQVRLAWTLHQGPHVLAIPGTSDPAHLTDNIAAAALRLSPDDLTALQ
jgi:aryl-alcohol dehydrogenase-like predicted oxidoreductase